MAHHFFLSIVGVIQSNRYIGAVMNVDGAWIDTQLRKLTAPPPLVVEALENAPKSEGFEWV